MQDPCSRGGCSYVLVNGKGTREKLAAPLDDTIFFAGEATDSEESGTVAWGHCAADSVPRGEFLDRGARGHEDCGDFSCFP